MDELIDRDTFVAQKAKLMSQKKTLEEQSSALAKGKSNWIEPFQEWILSARNAGEIAVNGSPEEKKVLAPKVFGSNLVLDCKKARGSCVKPWSLLVHNSSSFKMVPTTGLEPINRVFSPLPTLASFSVFIAYLVTPLDCVCKCFPCIRRKQWEEKLVRNCALVRSCAGADKRPQSVRSCAVVS